MCGPVEPVKRFAPRYKNTKVYKLNLIRGNEFFMDVFNFGVLNTLIFFCKLKSSSNRYSKI